MLFDLHNDLLTASDCTEYRSVLEGYSKDGLTDIVLAIWTAGIPEGTDISAFSVPETDIRVRLAIEGLGKLRASDRARAIRETRPVYVSLTWNGDDPLAGGCGCEKPLTEEGRRAVDDIAGSGCVLDVAHLSDIALRDALSYVSSRGCRVMCSHTACRALCAHPRCITDDDAVRIAEAGGIVGIAAVPNFLVYGLKYGENCQRIDYARHIAHMCSVVGSERVALGTDLYGTDYMPVGFGGYADVSALGDDLSGLGLTEKDIQNIFYKTAETFFAAGSDI